MSRRKPWDVHKFGGTSVGNADSMRKCIEIISPLFYSHRLAIVVSAMGGKPKVTDLLLDSVHAAAAGKFDESESKLSDIHKKHTVCVNDLLSSDAAEKILQQIESDLKDIRDLLRAVALMRMAHDQILELVSGYGEIWSASIMTQAMKERDLPFVFLNARDVLMVSEEELGTKVHWEESEQKLAKWIAAVDEDAINNNRPTPHLLITGYVASTLDGVATTLKRDGSDFSASIFGKMLRAEGITIWTDVSGVYSADPRRVPEAQIIHLLSYTEAIELAYFGAKVIHPKTMYPAIMARIPIYIRNTFEPSNPGTRIFVAPSKETLREHSVCGFSTIDNISLLNVEGSGMIGVPGIAHRLFGALKGANVSVMFIAQASSEHSICFATKGTSCVVAKKAVEEAFFYELKQGLISNVRVINDCSIIAAVGESMNNMPGVSGIFFGALGRASINVLSISQGCDERNISAVVYGKDSGKALRAVHAAFWLSSQNISIGIVGTGRVGTALMQTLIDQLQRVEDRFGISISVRGLANSRRMILGENLLDRFKGKLKEYTNKARDAELTASLRRRPSGYIPASHEAYNVIAEAMNAEDGTALPVDLSTFIDYVESGSTPHTIIIDCSNSSAVAAMHPAWIRKGSHIVTANKRAIASSLKLYNEVFTACLMTHRMYMTEVTIGASIPVMTTLSDMICSGDHVHSIVALVSVSVGMLLTDICDGKLSFSQALSRTYALGLFEEDVFRDLEGTEAAQKLLILVREIGISMRLSDVQIEPIATRREVESWETIGSAFAAEDALYAKRAAAAAAKGCTLRYVQRINCVHAGDEDWDGNCLTATASVRLEEVPLDSALALVKGAVYHFSFNTDRYKQNPLVVQGPLSDSANAASGLLGDILRIARSIGAKDRGHGALDNIPLYESAEEEETETETNDLKALDPVNEAEGIDKLSELAV